MIARRILRARKIIRRMSDSPKDSSSSKVEEEAGEDLDKENSNLAVQSARNRMTKVSAELVEPPPCTPPTPRTP